MRLLSAAVENWPEARYDGRGSAWLPDTPIPDEGGLTA